MTIEQVIQIVQVSYPQVYLACHTRHQRKRSTDHQLSPRDSSILSHLDVARPTQPSRLAAHLGVSRSTVSEAVKRLGQLGFVSRATADGGDRRSSGVLLSAKGARAIRDTSVLETARLRVALERATRADRIAIGDGMSRLAAACRNLNDPLATT